MQLKARILNKLRENYRAKRGLGKGLLKKTDNFNCTIDEYNKLLSTAILKEEAFMVARFGSEELKWFLNFISSKKCFIERHLHFVQRRVDNYSKEELSVIDNLTVLPRRSVLSTQAFYNEYVKAIPQIDILGSWLQNEKYLKLNSKVKLVELFGLEPYMASSPWTLALGKKRVLVIHPMKELIELQWPKRHNLFETPLWPEDCELIVLKAKYFDEDGVDTWSKMMDFYINEVNKIKFDVAIIGNGSWGMPLAAHIKLMGKVAIHLGGATQLLFGISGKRWENWKPYRALMNEHWTSGALAEQKPWFNNYDNKSYW